MIKSLSMIGSGIINADPTPYIALAWGLSLVVLGGLTAHALWRFQQSGKK